MAETNPRRLRSLKALALGLGAVSLLLFNTGARRGGTRYAELDAYRRLWGDMAVAVTLYLDATRSPEAPHGPRLEEPTQAADTYRRLLIDRITKEDVRPTEFWRTVRVQPFLRERLSAPLPPFEDPGRPLLLALGFRLLGGISPFLILWIGALITVPILFWAAWELVAAGRTVAGLGILGLFTSSPFVVEVLSFPRAPVGFYLVGAVLLLPIAVYGILGRPTPRGLVVRFLATGVLLAVAALGRSGSLFLLGGFLVAAVAAAYRMERPLSTPRRVLVVAATLAVLVGPYLLVRPAQHHDVWSALWEGLGDFDRSKGHVWSDPVAEAVVRDAGGDGLKTPKSEALFREMILREVRDDPQWLAEILAKRLFATVTLRKLWPFRPLDGHFMAPSTSPNEGFMHKYWRYTWTVDFLGFGRRAWEVPISLLAAPTVALLVMTAMGRRRSPRAPSPRVLLVPASFALATLPLPVLISTASGQEPQAFALTYFVGCGLLVDEAARRLRARWTARNEEEPVALRATG